MVESAAEEGLVWGGVQTGTSGLRGSCSAGAGFGGGASSSISQSEGKVRLWHKEGMMAPLMFLYKVSHYGETAAFKEFP